MTSRENLYVLSKNVASYITCTFLKNLRYYDVSGVRADGTMVALKRINTYHNVGEAYRDDPGSNAIDEVVFGSGFLKLRITLGGCFYLQGIGWKSGGCDSKAVSIIEDCAAVPKYGPIVMNISHTYPHITYTSSIIPS